MAALYTQSAFCILPLPASATLFPALKQNNMFPAVCDAIQRLSLSLLMILFVYSSRQMCQCAATCLIRCTDLTPNSNCTVVTVL